MDNESITLEREGSFLEIWRSSTVMDKPYQESRYTLPTLDLFQGYPNMIIFAFFTVKGKDKVELKDVLRPNLKNLSRCLNLRRGLNMVGST